MDEYWLIVKTLKNEEWCWCIIGRLQERDEEGRKFNILIVEKV